MFGYIVARPPLSAEAACAVREVIMIEERKTRRQIQWSHGVMFHVSPRKPPRQKPHWKYYRSFSVVFQAAGGIPCDNGSDMTHLALYL